MGRLQSEGESFEEVGLHNENENVEIEDSDEEEFEIAKEKAGYCKPVLLLTLVLLAIAIFLTRSQPTDSSFIAVPSTYLSTLFNQRPSSIIQRWLDPREPYLSLLIPAQTFPPPTCPLVWSVKCGASNLKTQGFMVHELETWLLANLSGSEKILIVWREDLAMAILLLSKRLQKDREFTDSPDAEIMVIIKSKDAQSPQFQALRLTLAKQDTFSLVSFAETDQWVLPENMAKYQFVIGPGSLLHANLIEPNLRESDPLDPTVQEEVGSAVFDAIPRTRLLLLYDGSPNEQEMTQFVMVKSQVIKIVPNQPNGYLEERVTTSSQLQFGSGLGLLLIKPTLSIPIQIQRHNNPQIQKQHQPQEQAQNSQQGQNQLSTESEQKRQQADSDLHTQNKWKFELMIVPTIKRLEGEKMSKIVSCSEPDNPDFILIGNFIRTHIQRIQIEREEHIQGDQLIDVTHLAKFLVDYFLTAVTSNVFCASDSPLLLNIISLANPDGNLFLYDSLRKIELLKRGLAHNGLTGHLHLARSKDFNLINFLKVEEIRLVVVDSHFVNDWRMPLQLALENQIQLLVKKQQAIEQIRLIENMAVQGGLHIYVIYPREDRQFDLGCLRDYQFELFANDVKYPHNTFFLLSRQELSSQSVDPSTDFSPAHRLVTINPYPCSSPPYLRSKKEPQKGYILMRSRYDLVVPVNPSTEYLFKKQGAQQIGLLELLRSSLIKTDRVFLYADASSNPLLPLILMRIVGQRGKLSITAMSKKQNEVLQLSLKQNEMAEIFQATQVQATDPRSINKLFLQLEPTVVITKPDLLQRDQDLLKSMPAGSMILFKYASQDYFFEGYLASLSQQHKLHEVYFDPRSDKTNLCNDFRLRSLTADNIAKHQFGWFVIQP